MSYKVLQEATCRRSKARIRDEPVQKRYGYLLTYGMRSKVLSWMGAVRAGTGAAGTAKGRPEGEVSFELPPLEEEQQRVARERLEEAIEALRGVEE